MPSRNRTKQYLEDSYYHIYNRGVEKRLIFQDEQDYAVFLSYLKNYLLPKDQDILIQRLSVPDISYFEKDNILKILRLNNFNGEITLLAYCLMPNHFHFFVKQKSTVSMHKFMQSLATRYTMYFNKKYKRVGSLYQDTYKAVLIETDIQFLYLSKYIHKQALDQPSSYPEYLNRRKSDWVHPEEILSYFSKSNPQLTYKSFVESEIDYSPIQKEILDEDY